MLSESVEVGGAPDTEQTKGMVTSLWFIAENIGGYVGSSGGGLVSAHWLIRETMETRSHSLVSETKGTRSHWLPYGTKEARSHWSLLFTGI